MRERELISVPICLSKCLSWPKRPLATPNSLERQIGTEIHALFLCSVLYCLLWLNSLRKSNQTFRSEFKWVTILTTLWTEYRLFNFRYCISMLQNFANVFFRWFHQNTLSLSIKMKCSCATKKKYFVVGSYLNCKEFSVSSSGIFFGDYFQFRSNIMVALLYFDTSIKNWGAKGPDRLCLL